MMGKLDGTGADDLGHWTGLDLDDDGNTKGLPKHFKT